MRPELLRQLLLAVLAVGLGVAIYFQWPSTTTQPSTPSNRRGPTAGSSGGTNPQAIAAPDVHLDALDADRTAPGSTERNLFKFKQKAAPPPPSPVSRAVAPPAPIVPSGPPPPPPLPPIALKFIGVLETGNAQKIAILSDGRGAPLYGKEGDTVLGQYKILRIGVESLEIAYLDGRGRQTIRLSGS
jgi:hypothetical protein